MIVNKNYKPSYLYLSFVLLFFTACQDTNQVNESCAKFSNEEYLFQQLDSATLAQIAQLQRWLLEEFEDSTVQDSKYEIYQLHFYSSHGFGSSIKFEKRHSTYWLSKRCIVKKGWSRECKEYEVAITVEEWNQLEKIIYEFNFWTIEPFKSREDVLDGYVYTLAGNRPQAKICNKKSYKLAIRGSPKYDKMGALCVYIQEYEKDLAFTYRKQIE